jgi:hypothetical protein
MSGSPLGINPYGGLVPSGENETDGLDEGSSLQIRVNDEQFAAFQPVGRTHGVGA